MNDLIHPMLATLIAEPFNRPGWVNEEKYDGIRALAYRTGKRIRLFSRNLKELTAEFPEVADGLAGLCEGDFVLDGEIVAFDTHDVSRFQILQRRALGEGITPLFAVFDCLEFTGKVGTGYSEELLADLAKKMAPLATANSPFQPAPPGSGVTWLHPRLVAQIAFAEWTQDGKLRQPAFLGLREDKNPADCQWSGRER